MSIPIVDVRQYRVIINGIYNYFYSTNPDLTVPGGFLPVNFIPFRALSLTSGLGVPIYQYHKTFDTVPSYYYTANANYGQDWINDGPVFNAFLTSSEGFVPIYRYMALNGKKFKYSTRSDENYPGWTLETLAFYGIPPPSPILPDYALNITNGSSVVIPANNAYSFGTGDFSITTLFRTSAAGDLVCRKAAGGIPGWTLGILANGVIKFTTDNGFGYYYVTSLSTKALNGQWHHVAAIRRGPLLEIWLDNVRQPISGIYNTVSSPCNVGSSPYQITFGNNEQIPSQFIGEMEDVTIWNIALSTTQLAATTFNLIEGNEAGLVGYWPMDYNLLDKSPTKCDGSPNGTISYVPIYTSKFVQGGSNQYSFVNVVNHATSSTPGDPTNITRTQNITVVNGAPFLVVSLCAMSFHTFPVGSTLTVKDPSGTSYTTNQNTSTLYVSMVGNSVYQMVVKNPMAGDWVTTITGNIDLPIHLCLSTVPSLDIVPTIQKSLMTLFKIDQETGDIMDSPFEGRRLSLKSFLNGSTYLGYTTTGLSPMTAIFNITQPTTPTTSAYPVTTDLLVTMGVSKNFNESMIGLSPQESSKRTAIDIDGDGDPNVQSLFQLIWNNVKVPIVVNGQTVYRATTNSSQFMDRVQMAISNNYNLHLDIGGQGYSESNHCGFPNAINVNTIINTTYQEINASGQYAFRPIPNNIILQDWNNPIPLQNGTVNYITMQGTTMTDFNVSEITRLIAPGGKVGLWINQSYLPKIQQLATNLNTTIKYSCSGPNSNPNTCSVDCVDEFNGNYSGMPLFTKICLTNQRLSSTPMKNDSFTSISTSSSSSSPINNENHFETTSSSSPIPNNNNNNINTQDRSIIDPVLLERMKKLFSSLSDQDKEYILNNNNNNKN